MNVYLISDTHFNHGNIVTYCQRPENFTEIIIKRWQQTVRPEDLVIHLGDVLIGKRDKTHELLASLPGKKILIRGNHDRQDGCGWWMDKGFDFACDGLVFRGCWLTHEPANALPEGCVLNFHGHLHNIWHGFTPDGPSALRIEKLNNPWQRLFAVEYTDYRPVEFNKFRDHPDKYQAQGPKK